MERARRRAATSAFAKYVNKPELAGLLPVLYPGVFPNLKAYKKSRADLNAILLTGIPEGVVPGFQNYTGPIEADMLRLNVAVPPSTNPNPIGLVAGDAAGFPNGRRIDDDVVTIELRAIAGLTIPLVDPSYTPDGAASAGHRRDDRHQRRAHEGVPLPRPAGRWLPDHARHDEGVMSAPAQVENPFAGQGSVLLDIGGEVGALVVTMPAAMVDVEVEIRPVGGTTSHGHGHHPHVAVVERPVLGAVVPSLVFPELVEGALRALRQGHRPRGAHGRGHRRRGHESSPGLGDGPAVTRGC